MNRILIVDDMAVNLMMTRELFHMTNCEDVDVCEDGETALSMVKEKGYDMILLDRRMPGMDGVEVLKHLREWWSEQGISPVPVVALSGDDSPGAAQKFREMGFDGYLAKPLSPEKLFFTCTVLLTGFSVLPRFGGEVFLDNEAAGMEEGDRSREAFDEIPSWLREAEEIDLNEGIRHSGSLRLLLEGLRIFASSIERRAQEIEESCRKEDWEDYLIRVHGLKGICGLLGLLSLRKQAEKLEQACMDEDAAFMREHTEELVSSYRKLQEVLAPVLGKERVRNASGTPAEKPAISPEQLADARVTIRECLNYYDYHSVGLVLDSLSEYALPPEEEKRMKELRTALDRIDRDALFRLLEGVM